MLRIERICLVHGTQAMISNVTGIGRPAVSRIVHGLEPPYPGRGQAIADAVGWRGDWHALFEEDEDGPDGWGGAPVGASGRIDFRRVPRDEKAGSGRRDGSANPENREEGAGHHET